LIGQPGDLREQFADADAGGLGGDGRERPAELKRGVGLGVPGVEVGGATPEPEEEHRLGGAAGRRVSLGPEAQQGGQREAEDTAGADLQKGPARQTLAGALPLPADEQHGRYPPDPRWQRQTQLCPKRQRRASNGLVTSDCRPLLWRTGKGEKMRKSLS